MPWPDELNWAAASPRTPRKTNTKAPVANDVILDGDIETHSQGNNRLGTIVGHRCGLQIGVLTVPIEG